MYVYYYRTYEIAESGGGERGKKEDNRHDKKKKHNNGTNGQNKILCVSLAHCTPRRSEDLRQYYAQGAQCCSSACSGR